jgi:hypothetical protein
MKLRAKWRGSSGPVEVECLKRTPDRNALLGQYDDSPESERILRNDLALVMSEIPGSAG